jgi:phosphoribosyl 1,2-cyclic phosphate phosphodiesterase
MSLNFTILGCGSSMGVPRVALGWGLCDPTNPKNRRRRCALLIERAQGLGKVTRALIDCTPDLREQLLDAEVDWLDGVLITHEHADHTHGIDDLRPLFVHKRRRLDIWLDEPTSRALRARFGYCFQTPPGSEYPPILTEHRLTAGQPVTIDGQGGPIEVMPVLQNHGDIASLGFRIGDVAYSADIKGLPAESLPLMTGLHVWIVDALRKSPHPSHFNLDEALAWIARIQPERAILTNLHTDMDYAELRAALPPNVEPGFDRMRFSIA